MDLGNQPSTSKKATQNNEKTIYPVSFDVFKKFTNVEEFVVNEMERAGPEIYRINYKRRHRYYPIAYQQFYEDESKRKKMMRHGLTVKAVPKFLKDKFMLMAKDKGKGEVSDKTSKDDEKQFEKENHHTEKSPSNRIPKHNNVTPQQNTKSPAINGKNSANKPLNNKNQSKKPLALDSEKITNYFCALELSNKSNTTKDKTVERKRKQNISADNSTEEPQIKQKKYSSSHPFEKVSKNQITPQNIRNLTENSQKKLEKKNDIHPELCRFPTDLLSEDSESAHNVQVIVDISVPVDTELSELAKSTKKTPPKPQLSSVKKEKIKLNHKKTKTKSDQKRQSHKRKRPCSSDDLISDDSNVKSCVEILDLSGEDTVQKSKDKQVTSPLPRRIKTEEFQKVRLSIHEPQNESSSKSRERHQLSSVEGDMALLSVSEVDTSRVGYSTTAIHEWIEKGLQALQNENDVEPILVEYCNDTYLAVDKLTAIYKYPNEVKQYIRYLVNLEIQKQKKNPVTAPLNKLLVSRSKVVTAFYQMTFEEYRHFTNAEKLLSQKAISKESHDSNILTDLMKEFESIMMRKENPWPKGVYFKFQLLKKFLRSKELQGILKLDHLPPRILSFEDILEYTNLKEFTSLKQSQPPELYKTLLQLCKKEYTKCCQKGFWTEGIEFTNEFDLEDVTVDSAEVQNDELISMPPLNVNSSDLRTTQQCVIPGAENLSTCSLDEHLTKEGRSSINETEKGSNSDKRSTSNTFLRSTVQEVANDHRKKKENASERTSNQIQDKSSKPTAFGTFSQINNEIESFFRSAEDNSQSKMSKQNMDNAELGKGEDCLTSSQLISTLLGESEGSKTQQTQGHQSQQLFTELENLLENVVNTETLRISQEGSVEVITSGSSVSARQLLSNIVEPSQPVPLASSTKLSITVTAPTQDLSLKNQNTTELIPPSPNLFPSSGESIPKCKQFEQIKIRSPETVFVSCKHSMTCQEEESNLTTLNAEQQSDLEDPFANTSINQENADDTVTQDPSLVVKQEMIPICNDDVENSYNGLDDSVQIIDLPPSEPISIEDEETTPELLDMLLNYPARTSRIDTDVAHFPHMSTFSILDNFPQAQNLLSNLSLTQSKQSQDEPKKLLELFENIPEIESPEASPYGRFRANIDMITNKTTDQTIESRPNGCKISQRILNKEFSSFAQNLDSVATNMSFESIAPQRIPSEIELTQTSSSNLINLKQNNYQGYNAFSAEDKIINEDLNTTQTSIDLISLQDLPDSQRGVSSEENERRSDESTVSVYVYLTQEGTVSDVISKNPKSITTLQEPIENTKNGDLSSRHNKTCSNTNTSKVCNIEQHQSSLLKQEKDVVSMQVSANSEPSITENATSSTEENVSKSAKDTNNLSSQAKKSEENILCTKDDRINCLQNRSTEELIDKRTTDQDTFKKTNSSEIVIKGNTLLESNRREKTLVQDKSIHPLKEGGSTSTSDFRLLKNVSHEVSVSGENKTSGSEDEHVKTSSNIEPKIIQTDEGSKDIVLLCDKLETKAARNQAVHSVLGQDELFVNKSKQIELLDDGHEASTSLTLSKNSQVELVQNSDVDEIIIINSSAHEIRISVEISSQEIIADNSIDTCPTSEKPAIETDNENKCIDVTSNCLCENNIAKNKETQSTHNFPEKMADSVLPPVAASTADLSTSKQAESTYNFPLRSVSSQTSEISKSNQLQFSSKASKHNFPSKTVDSELPPVTAHTLELSILEQTGENAMDKLSYKIPALLPISCTQNGKTYNLLEASSLIRKPDDQNEDEQLVEVPFLIKRKFLKSLPFNAVIPERIEHDSEDSTIYAIDINLEYKAEKRGIKITESEKIIKGCESQLSPSISFCQYDKQGVKDSLEAEDIVSHCPVMNVQTTVTQAVERAQKKQRTHISIPLKELRLQSCDPSTILGEQSSSGCRKLLEKEKSVLIRHKDLPPKAKPQAKQKKKKASPKKLSKKQQESDFVPQITHAYRSLPLATGKKPFTSKSQAEEESPAEEDKDLPLENGSQAVALSTASQILGTDCTYFESSQLLQNIDHCSQPHQLVTPTPDIQPPAEPKVNIFSRIVLSEGIMARKIWKVHLEWKRKNTMSIEIKFITNKRWLTVCDKSAKLMFNFSPTLWSDVLRVLREIDRFDYKRLPNKKFRAATPLHNVLQVLFNNAERVVNVRLVDSSFSPYASCEKYNPVNKRPFQCLTKGIPRNILSRMKDLKENLQNQQ